MGLFSRRSSQDTDNVALAAARGRLSPDDVDQVRFLITTKKAVHAVKLIHDRTGLDLKQTKELVDDIRLGRYVPPTTGTPLVRRPGTNLRSEERRVGKGGRS